MPSSTSSRSRSNRRSPRRGESPTKALEPEPENSEAPKGVVLGEKPPEEKAAEEKETVQTKPRTTGAVQNRRKKGAPGTWTCPECDRTIADNACSKQQHWDSLYCRAARLYNQGCGSYDECKKRVEKDVYQDETPAKDEGKVKLRSMERSRGSQRPPEPAIPPRKDAPPLDKRVAPYLDSPVAWERNVRHWSRARNDSPQREVPRELPASRSKRSRSRADSRHRRGRERESRRPRSEDRGERESRMHRSEGRRERVEKGTVGGEGRA